MGNLFFTIEFISALAIFFFIASLIGHLLKLDEYMRTHDFHDNKTISENKRRYDHVIKIHGLHKHEIR